MNQPGMLITLEGPDGSGKSTQALLLIRFLKKAGFKVLHTREPGVTRSRKVSAAALVSQNQIVPEAELFLYWASRAQHVQQIIKPALQRAG